jgi:hypothetical protein
VAAPVSGAPAAVAIGLATSARADDGGSASLPPGGPVSVYAQDGTTGAENPYIPSGADLLRARAGVGTALTPGNG